tara:strand:+ start:1570 stop:2718 length:1149 start_codon:yes stop_codon:yes gene_type:complete
MRSVQVLDVADSVASTPGQFEGERDYFATADVADHGVVTPSKITFATRPSRANLVVEVGDVLFAKMSETRKVLEVNKQLSEAIFSTGFFNLRPRPGLLFSRYLYWFLNSYEFQFEKERRVSGATQKALTLRGLRDIAMPLPEIGEQRRIAAILDTADAIRRGREQALALTDDLLRSTFLEMFGDPVTNPKGLPVVAIHQLADITTGNTPSRKNDEYYGDGIEWIKSDNINTADHHLTVALERLSELGQKVGRVAPAGSTLITCIAGSPSCIGNAAIADRAVAFNQQINALIPKKNVNAYFLYTQVLVAKSKIQNASTNSMKGMVSKGKLKQVGFLSPNADAQNEFGQFFSSMHNSRIAMVSANGASHVLASSLSQRAFRGEL